VRFPTCTATRLVRTHAYKDCRTLRNVAVDNFAAGVRATATLSGGVVRTLATMITDAAGRSTAYRRY
jgi:hypothetical protein